MALSECKKKPAHFSAPMSLLRDLHQVEAAMDAGLNVGAVTHLTDLPGINPLGFFDLDIDGPDHGLDLSPFTFRVRRQGIKDRAHYLARQPDPSIHLHGFSGVGYDLCTWNTVIPGSVHADGTVYELEYLDNGEWVQLDGERFSIEALPVVDPELYRIEEKRRKQPSNKVQRLKTKPGTEKSPSRISTWIAATGSFQTRKKMARHYLCYHAWKSISGRDGHSALLVVVTNLRLYHGLDQATAMMMLKEHFNPRCADLLGNPCPWSDAELQHKWNEAGKPGAYPTLGVANPKAKQKKTALMLQGEVAGFLGRFTQEGGTSNPTALRQAFIAFRGGEDVNATAFGRAVSKVTGIQTTTPNGKRVYQGIRLAEAGLGFTRCVPRVCLVA